MVLYNLEDQNVWDLVAPNNVLDLNDFWMFYYNFLPSLSLIPQSLITSQFCRKKYEFSINMNTFFDNPDYGEIYLYQYAHDCPRLGVYRGEMKKFKNHQKIEIRHSCCDCETVGCGYWTYYLKGSGIWLDLGRTIAFENHYDAINYFLPNQPYNNLPLDQKRLQTAAIAAGYNTIQFTSNNEYGIFLYEIMDLRYDGDTVSCPKTTKHIYQFASKPYECKCINSKCLNCKISNPSYQGQFPSCFSCYQYKYNSECLPECPTGTITRKAYYSDEQYICISSPCTIEGCQKCASPENKCIQCYQEYSLINEECVKTKLSINLKIKFLIFIIYLLFCFV